MVDCKWHWFVFPWEQKKLDEQLACYNKMIKGGSKTRRNALNKRNKSRRASKHPFHKLF